MIFGVSRKEMFLDRFWRGFWIGFGEVFGEVLERFWSCFGAKLDTFSMLPCMPCWNWFLERFISNLDRFCNDLARLLNEFGGLVGMILLMRSRCQVKCEAMSRYYCEADVKTNAKPMSR